VQHLHTWKWILLALTVSFCTATQAKLPERLSLDQGWRDVNVLVEAAPGQPSGLWGSVVLEPGQR
jgi:beta-galactosidase